ncbi:hypothetical protein D021_1620A, partial [Vibrio parahaemolyticus 10296]|jgi:transposase InsO family protein
MLLPH